MCGYQCPNGHVVPGYANTRMCPQCGKRLSKINKSKSAKRWRGSRKNDDRVKR